MIAAPTPDHGQQGRGALGRARRPGAAGHPIESAAADWHDRGGAFRLLQARGVTSIAATEIPVTDVLALRREGTLHVVEAGDRRFN